MAFSRSLACLVLLVSTAPAYAATQGTPGPTSTGTITINATITPEVNITGLDDITFDATILRTALNTGADAGRFDELCVWSNNPDRSYFLTATGDGAGNAFTLNDGTRTLPYNVLWTAFGSVINLDLDAGVKSQLLTSQSVSPDCAGGTTAKVLVEIANADIAAMEATTTYTGVLTLLVSPS